jgi:hypothetical protein
MLALGIAHNASADITLYDNGTVNGTIGSWPINDSNELSNSFTLNSPATVDAVRFGAWTYPNSPTTSIEWSIGTSFYSASLGTGVANVTSTPVGQHFFYPIESDIFSLNSPVALASGTYYLTLQNAVAGGFPSYWDVSDGPSSARLNGPDNNNVDVDPYSNSFEVLGNFGTVPEPSGVVPILIGTGVLGLLMYRRRQLRTVSQTQI